MGSSGRGVPGELPGQSVLQGPAGDASTARAAQARLRRGYDEPDAHVNAGPHSAEPPVGLPVPRGQAHHGPHEVAHCISAVPGRRGFGPTSQRHRKRLTSFGENPNYTRLTQPFRRHHLVGRVPRISISEQAPPDT